MHIIDDDLYFVIEEKQNTVDIMEKGIELVSNNAEEAKLFIMPDVGSEIAELEKLDLDPKEKLNRKNDIYRNFSIASERIHTIHQLLKAYTMFEKDETEGYTKKELLNLKKEQDKLSRELSGIMNITSSRNEGTEINVDLKIEN